MASRIVQESDTDRKLKIMDIVNDLTTMKNKKVQVEQILVEAQMQEMLEEDVTATIDELLDLGLISQPEIGFIQRA
ncbi:hypothetical protein GOV10_04530 [Candidatus Woesearchaeota archaeon]|nr:hypothetical protein [Candidatus Woesearchaeota archaeon]